MLRAPAVSTTLTDPSWLGWKTGPAMEAPGKPLFAIGTGSRRNGPVGL
jgi:hypothetical protein